MNMKEKFGLYIHIPYCESKCGYCDFTSYTDQMHTIPEYLQALVKEARYYHGCVVDTVYIGGGTPSCLRSGDIFNLMTALQKEIEICKDAEISIEANPNSLSREKAEEFWAAGINRLSIGLQTVQPDLLKRIGRTHIYADFQNALENAVKAGFSNISADLMYSLPGECAQQAIKSAQAIVQLPLMHISAYALRLERGTPLYGAEQPDEMQDREMFYGMKQVFEEAGFMRYEISNFAKEGYCCKHNLKYWREQEYIGLGVAAHSYYQGYRYGNTASISGYIHKIYAGQTAEVQCEKADKQLETIMLKTRLCEGIPLADLPQTKTMQNFLQMLEQHALAKRVENALVLTERGMDIHNTIVLELLKRI